MCDLFECHDILPLLGISVIQTESKKKMNLLLRIKKEYINGDSVMMMCV